MKIGKYLSTYARASDIERPTVITIDRVDLERIESDEQGAQEKLVLYARGATKGVVCSKTALAQLNEIFGSDETNDWIGRRCIIFNDVGVSFRGVRGGIRFRGVDQNGAPPRAAAPPPPRPAAPPAPVPYSVPPREVGDEGPFGEVPF
jgi:hypothetical protein